MRIGQASDYRRYLKRRRPTWTSLVVAMMCVAAGCQPAEPPVEHAAVQARPTEAKSQAVGATAVKDPAAAPWRSDVLVPGAEQRTFARMFEEEYKRAAPADDGWASEVFQDAAAAQLKVLAKAIEHPGQKAGKAIAGVADASFQPVTLRPVLQEVYRDDVLVVSRSIPGSSSGNVNGGADGAAALAAAVDQLAAPLHDGRDMQLKIKVIGVQMEPERAGTRVLYQASGLVDGRVVQQTATWVCGWNGAESARPTLASIKVLDHEEVATVRGGPLFEDSTEAVLSGVEAYQQQFVHGVDHWRARLEKTLAPYISGLKGLALGDVNNDDLEDIYICQGAGLPNRLLVQQPDGTLRDISRAAGVDWMDSCNSALLVDLDNDGDQDLLVGSSAAVIMHRNEGGGTFSLGETLKVTTLVTGLSAADFDNDGLLDVYVLGRTGADDDGSTVLGLPFPYQDANNGGQNLLYRNLGDWSFEDVTKHVGLEQNNRRFSWAAAWEDYDNDGDLDLYVANDFGRNNLYRFDHAMGRFEDVAAEAGVEDIASGMSVSWGDYNADGLMDLYVSNMYSSAGNRITFQRNFRPGADQETLANIRRMARGNSLFENVGGGRFRDVSVEAGITMGRWAWGSKFVDINNDGREDLIVANGFVTQQNPDDL